MATFMHERNSGPTTLEKIAGGAVAGYVVVDAIRTIRQWHKMKDTIEPDAARYYDHFARLYDVIAGEANWEEKAAQFIGKAVEIKSADTIRSAADLGAGNGYSVRGIQKHASPERVVAVDISPKMLERFRASEGNGTAIETVEAPIERYVRESEDTFDLITSMSVLEYVPDLPDVLEHIPRLLNKGGVFAATYVSQAETSQHMATAESPFISSKITQYSWFPEEVERSLTEGGLTILHRDNSQPAYELGSQTVHYNFVVAGKPL